MPVRHEYPDPLFSGRAPVSNMDAEKTVIGSCILSDVGRSLCMQSLEPIDFYAEKNEKVFRVLREAEKAGAVHFLALCDMLQARGLLEEIGGTDYLQGCMDICLSPDTPEVAIGIVKDKSNRRRMVRALLESRDLVEDQTRPFDEVQAGVEGKVLAVRTAPVDTTGPEEWAEQLEAEAAAVEAGGEGRRRVKTGLTLDTSVNMFPGQLTTLGGGTSQGKTAVAITITRNAVLRLNERTYYWSGEMNRGELWERMAAAELCISYERVQKRELTPTERARIKDLAATIKKAPLTVRDEAKSVAEIRAECRWIAAKQGQLDLIVVDYLSLTKDLNSEAEDRDRRDTRVGKVVWELIQTAKELDCHVLMLHQLNRQKDMRSNGRPRLSDLRESGAIEHHSHNVIFPYRPDRDESLSDEERDQYLGCMEIVVGKARGGKIGSLWFGFNGDYQQVLNKPKPWPAPVGSKKAQGRRGASGN